MSSLVARQAACDADIARIVLGPNSLPTDVGRAQRLMPAHIRRAAEVRDGGCVFTGCHNPAWMCDAHHVVHWIDGTEILIGPLTDTRGDPVPDLHTVDPPLFPRRA